MAFLCPVRIRSSSNNSSNKKIKKKKILKPLDPITMDNNNPLTDNNNDTDIVLMGRVTGSDSIETLVGKPQKSKQNSSLLHLVLHDFTPCVDDELEVRRGDVVTLLYREHDWAYVVLEIGNNNSEDNSTQREGFIPFSYLVEYEESGEGDAKEERTTTDRQSDAIITKEEASNAIGSCTEFLKTPALSSPTYITLYTFHACNENDLSIHRGQLLTVLNKDDPDWFWVSVQSPPTEDGQSHPPAEEGEKEGFVPSAFIFPVSYLKEVAAMDNTNNKGSGKKDVAKGTELVMLYDYKAQAPDDLSVKRGDWVYADLEAQTVEGWLWAWGARQRRYGFLPRAYARVPAMTSL